MNRDTCPACQRGEPGSHPDPGGTHPAQLHRYTVKYRRLTGGVGKVKVLAPTTDAARAEAKRLDPDYLATTESPRRTR